MDTVTARDYIHTYPTINKILTDYYPKPRYGFSEEDLYTILEEELRIRDSRIKDLEFELSHRDNLASGDA